MACSSERQNNNARVQYVNTTPDPRPENYVKVADLLNDEGQPEVQRPGDIYWWCLDVEGWSNTIESLGPGLDPLPLGESALRGTGSAPGVGRHHTDLKIGITRQNDFALMDIAAGMRITLEGAGINASLWAPFDPDLASGPGGNSVSPTHLRREEEPGLTVAAGQILTTAYVQCDQCWSLAPIGEREARFTESRNFVAGANPAADALIPVRPRAVAAQVFANGPAGVTTPFRWSSGPVAGPLVDRGQFDFLGFAAGSRQLRTGVVDIPGNADFLNIGIADTRLVTVVWHLEW